MNTLYQLCTEALDDAGWQHSEPNAADTLGTQVLVDGQMIGGSLRVIDGRTVRFLAFNAIYPPEELDPTLPAAQHRRPAVEHLLAALNPTFDGGHFELDPVLGVVCRTSGDFAPALAVTGDQATVAAVVKATVMTLVGRATAQMVEQRALLEAVVAGADPDVALAGRTAA